MSDRIIQMPNKSLLFVQLPVVALLAVLHIYAIEHLFYWRFPWFDIIPHLLGGLWAGLFAFWLARGAGKEPSILFCAGIVIALGISWEFFEAFIGITRLSTEMLDTIGDIFMDIAGGVSGVYLARFISRPSPLSALD